MDNQLVRFSRDGDQFHYLWAARRCLRLLSSASGLTTVTIEGASPAEIKAGDPIEAGNVVIDVGEYYGSEDVAKAQLVRYIQLKHSTQHAGEAWTPSGIENTLKGFAGRYEALHAAVGAAITNRLEFVFVSNRPVAQDILETVEDAANGATPRHPAVWSKLEQFTGLTGSVFNAFCTRLRLQGKQEGYWDQRNILSQEISGYLPDADADAPIALKELVTKKALSESADTPQITKIDVLRALKTDESHLFPAPCLISVPETLIPRELEQDVFRQIVNASARPILLYAEAGVGKSIFATQIQLRLPEGSLCVVYDCFGNGQYRSVSGYRHRHKEGLVQIANELAQVGLCYPLIPAPHADASAYIRAFRNRITQSIDSLRTAHPHALLCIVIDAADNAQVAAQEISEPRSFARDLLREPMPDGARLVLTCRTHRIEYLDPPPHTLKLQLKPFNRVETERLLRLSYPDATDLDVDEFHRLTSHNPRVQATALSRKLGLPETLRALGPNPKTVDDTLSHLLNEAILRLRDQVGTFESAQVDAICSALAVLRPLVPISVLAAVAQVSEAAVKSFAIDLGRPLLLLGDAVQFFDEPAETWFKARYKPKAADFTAFIDRLKPLATESAYIASTLPQLLLEAGHISELVELALSSTGLPASSPVEKRDVDLQRLQFALKAVLRAKRYAEASKLALKAGGVTAGETRLQDLIQKNTDVAAQLLDPNRILEIISRRAFVETWAGAHYVYEAGLMSARDELRGDARSRLRMAHEWLRNWSRLPPDERDREKIADVDISELALTHLNIYGPSNCAQYLRSWRPREVSFRAGQIVARRLIDHGRYEELDELGAAARNDIGLVLAALIEAREVNRLLPKQVVARTLRLVQSHRVTLSTGRRNFHEGALVAVTELIGAASLLAIAPAPDLACLLARSLPESPPRGLSSPYGETRFALLRAYALRAALRGETLALTDVAFPELRKKLEEKPGDHAGGDGREYQEGVAPLLPWHQLWADALTGRVIRSALQASIDLATSSLRASTRYEDRYRITDEAARLYWQTITGPGNSETGLVDSFAAWINSLEKPLSTSTLTFIARGAGRTPSLHRYALEFASKTYRSTKDQRIDAATKADTYVELARSILPVSPQEASAYFDQAVDVAGKFGDEVSDRWQAILDLADRATSAPQSLPELAYKLSRCAEVTYDYVEDKHFPWRSTIGALVGLHPPSAIAILSRWRDRHFGRATRALPIAVECLLGRKGIDGRLALALIGFRASWDYSALLDSALYDSPSKLDKHVVADFAYRYMQLTELSASTWRTARETLSKHSISVPALNELVSFTEQAESSAKSANEDARLGQRHESSTAKDWEAIFAGLDLHSPQGISAAYRRYWNGDPPFYRDRFLRQVFSRIDIGRAAEAIRALPDVPQFDLYDFRSLLKEVPDEWRSQLSVTSALGEVLKTVSRRHCMSISKNRYYEPLPIHTACEICGVAEADLLDEVLVAIGEAPELIDAGHLFTVVGLLASRLSEVQALDGLRFGLALFDSVITDNDGDGPWSLRLQPPADIIHAVAGYIWVALGAPEARIRWEAAHVVRGLCRLQQSAVIASLLEAASRGDAGPFSYASFYFYSKHSLQWLTIALARAAHETPEVVARHLQFLLRLAVEGDPHVVIRGFAASAALALMASGLVSIDPSMYQRLTAINESKYPKQSSKRYKRRATRTAKGSDSTRFHLGMDFGPYWIDPLASCFGLTEAEVTDRVDRLIVDEWGHKDFTGWEKDERSRRGTFDHLETYYRHSSYPRADDLRFYLSYHALMVTAGRLLASMPLHQDPDDADDEFADWISGHVLARDDERWLADRRDPQPLEWPPWRDSKRDEDWRWSVLKEDFERVLGIGTERLTVWGDWTGAADMRLEAIEVRSALVSTKTSVALLRALQTADNPHDYYIPRADDDGEIHDTDFQLRGWVTRRTRAHGIDELDMWVGSITYPPLTPAAWILHRLGLVSDSEFRVWAHEREQEQARKEVMWSRSWGPPSERDDDEESAHGERLQCSFDFVDRLLQEMGMDLLLEARIKRRATHSRYERDRNSGLEYSSPYTRVFIVKADGRICSL